MSGYSNYAMSNNAIEAYHCGLLPASKAAKVLKVTVKALRETLSPAEWHHTSCHYNVTDFFDIRPHLAILAGEFEIGGDGIDESVYETAEELVLMRQRSIKAVAKATKIYHNCRVRWVEWSGTRNHPQACEYECFTDVLDKGGAMFEFEHQGNILRKKKQSKWAEVYQYVNCGWMNLYKEGGHGLKYKPVEVQNVTAN